MTQSQVSNNAPRGMLFVDKPPLLTSHDVVQVVRRKLGIRRVGHTGTLDPMARGLLILLVGEATKYQQAFQGHDKTYEALIQLGTQTDTADAAGLPIKTAPVPILYPAQVASVLAQFHGERLQTPPRYSAVKIHGHPAYWWARRKRDVLLTPRVIRLFDVRMIDCTEKTIALRVHCSAGTYLRVIAEEIAQCLGTVGHLAKLTRLQIGEWNLERAKPFSWIVEATFDQITQQLWPIKPALH